MKRSKLENKATKCWFIGYGSVTKGYKMYDVESKRIFFSRNVTFDELIPPEKLIESPTSPLVVFPDESGKTTSGEVGDSISFSGGINLSLIHI